MFVSKKRYVYNNNGERISAFYKNLNLYVFRLMKDYVYGQPTCLTFDRTLSFFGTILLFGTSSLSLCIENTINSNKIGFLTKKKKKKAIK